MDTATGDMKLVQAMRACTKGQKTLKAMVMAGNATMAQGQMMPSSAETDQVEVTTQALNGFQVMQRHVRKEDGGAVMVLLGGSNQRDARFVMRYTGLRPGDALSWAKKFNWRKMQKVAAKIN